MALPAMVSAQPSQAPDRTVGGGDLAAELARARAELARQREQLDTQEQRLRALEARLNDSAAASATPLVPVGPAATPPAPVVAAAQGAAGGPPGSPTGVQSSPVQTVGTAPEELQPLELAVLGMQGSAITRPGALSGELTIEYARADRNRALFRGVEVIESVLIGVFDINENRQDILTAAGTLRYGITPRLELGVRVPYVYRADRSVLTPISGSTPNDVARTRDLSANGDGIGDIELSARYQLTRGDIGEPFFIANLQVVAPTGTSPFNVRRDSTGRAFEAATGSGFWGISPSVTAILPTDPAVLFGTLGYTFNLARNVNTQIPPVRIDRVDPGDSISASGGIGVSLNQRTSFNLGYAHTWAFGSDTTTRLLDPGANGGNGQTRSTTRDLQIGRLLFGVTYRASDVFSINWSVEAGVTDDAPDVRTVLRVPLVLITGS